MSNNTKFEPYEISQFIEDLQTGDEMARRYAAEDLGYGRHKEGIDPLVNSLTDPSIAVAEACADALVKIGGEEVVEKIAPYLASEDVRLRNHAVEILSLLGETALPILRTKLKSEDRDVRKFAVDTLVGIGSDSSMEALVEALNDPDVNIASTAADGLGEIGNEKHLPVLEKYLDTEIWMKCAVIRSIGSLGGEKAFSIIAPLIHDEDLMVKITAIQALARIKDSKAIEPLLQLLDDENLTFLGTEVINAVSQIFESNPEMNTAKLTKKEYLQPLYGVDQRIGEESRIKTIEILGRMTSEDSIPYLIQQFRDESEEIREVAVASIIKINPSNIDNLISLLKEPSSTFEQRSCAIKCLGRLEHAETQGLLRQYLTSDDTKLCKVTLDSLPSGLKEVPFQAIIDLLDHESPGLRIAAAQTMERLGYDEFVEALIRHLDEKDPEVLDAVDQALIHIGTEKGNQLILPYLESFSTAERKMAFEHFGSHHPETIGQKFFDGLKDPNPDIRTISYKVIANLKLADLQMVKEGLLDPVPNVQVQAARVLHSFDQNAELFEFLSQVMPQVNDPRERLKVEMIQILSGLAEYNVVDFILPFLKDDSSWVKIEAVEAFKVIGDKKVTEDLKELLDSEDFELVDAVERALEELEF